MKKNCLLVLALIMSIQMAKSQETIIQGKPIAEIFSDFHYTANDTLKSPGFGLNRAYFGYNFRPEGNFSGTVILNVGSPEDLTLGAKHRKYAFFREASITWEKDKLKMSFGITTTRATIFQQIFLGKRYIADNFQSKRGYAIVADLGLVADYQINDYLKVDFTLTNGEGYSEIQLDKSLKTSLGVNIIPFENMVIRIYGDIDRPTGVWQSTLIGFLGYKNDAITIGFEGAYKSNLDKIYGHDAWGFSGTISKRVVDKTEVFARYDYTTSVKDPVLDNNWDYFRDGQFAVFGVQYALSPNVKVALDYQGILPDYSPAGNTNGMYLNARFSF